MIIEILLGSAVAAVSGFAGFAIARKLGDARFELYTEQARAKARVIEAEAELVLERAQIAAQKKEQEAQYRYDNAETQVKRDFAERERALQNEEQQLRSHVASERESIRQERSAAEQLRLSAERQNQSLKQLMQQYQERIEEVMDTTQRCAQMSKEEARTLLLSQVEEQSREQMGRIIRRYEKQAKEEGEKRANHLLALATSRYAGDFASERLISIIQLEDDELKGRIIGKEGRNIKTLELVSGVDIIIDETPREIVVSSFNLYRRAVAVETIERLIEDGRIQPARIEEIHAQVSEEFTTKTKEEGEQIVFELGLGTMHPELLKLLGRLRYRASYGQNALAHTVEVAHLAGMIASELGGDARLARRAGLLHDIGKALTQEMEGSHVELGAEVCRRYHEDPVVINAIYAHHEQEEIKSVECAAVCAADTLSAARPGARREVLERFLKRVSEIEEIASRHLGVKQAYAINAGREVRVIVNAELLSDDESALLATEIASEIETRVSYPGDVKINVIRESRTTAFAR